MKKLLAALWKWIVRVFSLPKAEQGSTQTKNKVPSSSGEKPKPTDIPIPSTSTASDGERKGYNAHFLDVAVPLPELKVKEPVPILNYRHFSISMNRQRKMPYFTAVNIDAVKYNKMKSEIPSRKEMGSDNWKIDPRMDKTAQLPKTFYSKNDFDLGHIVRREDALWGDTLQEVIAANKDTFFLTNAAPQHKDFNRNAQRWKGLEDYALRNARLYDLRLSVFTGCIFTDKDRRLATIQIPAKFWKVIVMIKEDGTPSATGYIVNQDDLIEDITERELFIFEQFKTYQIDLKTIELATGLAFGLNDFDPLQKVGTRGLIISEPILIDDPDKIVF